MMKDQFGQDYPISVRDFRVSDRSDFFIKINQDKNLLLDTDGFMHLLPKNETNKKVYERALKHMFGDLERNKNNTVYNFGYKMQEGLRTLCSGLTTNILQMRHGLDELFRHLERSQNIESRALLETEKRLVLVARRRDEL